MRDQPKLEYSHAFDQYLCNERHKNIDKRFETAEKRFDSINKKIDLIDDKLDTQKNLLDRKMDKRFQETDSKIEKISNRFLVLVTLLALNLIGVASTFFVLWQKAS